jgi:hypothetical protein
MTKACANRGSFAFAMTLLVINIELPEGFHPKTNRERAFGPLRHVHSLSHHLFGPRRLLVRARRGDRRTGHGEPGLCTRDAPTSPGGHLPAVLDAGGEPIRFGSGCLELRRQYESLVRDGVCHLARGQLYTWEHTSMSAIWASAITIIQITMTTTFDTYQTSSVAHGARIQYWATKQEMEFL